MYIELTIIKTYVVKVLIKLIEISNVKIDNYLSTKIKNISFILTILVVILYYYNISNTTDISITSYIQRFISYGIATIAIPIFFYIKISYEEE